MRETEKEAAARVARSVRETARYQAQLGDEAEREGDPQGAAKWRARSSANWRTAGGIEASGQE